MFTIRLRKLRSALCTLGLIVALVLFLITTQLKSTGNLSYFYTSTVYHNSRHVHRNSFNIVGQNGKKRKRLFPENSKFDDDEDQSQDMVVLGLQKQNKNADVDTNEAFNLLTKNNENNLEWPSIEVQSDIPPTISSSTFVKQSTKVVDERKLETRTTESSEVLIDRELIENENVVHHHHDKTTNGSDINKSLINKSEITTQDYEVNEFEESQNIRSGTETTDPSTFEGMKNTIKEDINTQPSGMKELDIEKELRKHLDSNTVSNQNRIALVGNHSNDHILSGIDTPETGEIVTFKKQSVEEDPENLDDEENNKSTRYFKPPNHEGAKYVTTKTQDISATLKGTSNQTRTQKTFDNKTEFPTKNTMVMKVEPTDDSLEVKVPNDTSKETPDSQYKTTQMFNDSTHSKGSQNRFLSSTIHPSTTQEAIIKDESIVNPKIVVPKDGQKCKPVESVVFLKTHKTGSSTILNIFQRYSERKKLSMALPRLPEANHRLGWPFRFSSSWVFEYMKGDRYNLFANHARFNRDMILSVMKEPHDTKFITILRDPLRQLESSAVYFHFDRTLKIPKENLVDHFLEKVETDRDLMWNITRKPRGSMFLVKNPNAFDLGYPTWLEDRNQVDKVVDTVKNDFHLVMISDYMIESLVLLKDELCWELEDVIYFTLNRRPKKHRQKIKDDSSRRDKVRRWNNIDYKLFEHYNQTFWERVNQGGERFQKDVERLKLLNKEMEEKCIDRGTYFDKSQPWFPILGYKIRDEANGTDYHELCQQMIRPEIEYNNVLRNKQSRHGWTVPPKKIKRKAKPTKKGL